MAAVDAEAVRATPFPGGSVTIGRDENAEVCRITAAPALPEGVAHPIFAYVSTRKAGGLSVEEICAAADFQVEDGPMLGSLELRYAGELRTEVPYAVRGRFTNLVRKEGRSGTFDILSFDLELVDPGDAVVVEASQSWILPRREAADG